MTTATDSRAGSRGSAVRYARAVVVALLAALAVLIHHNTTSAAMPARAMSAMVGMDHTSATMTMTTTAASAEHGTALQAANMAMDDDSGACSGPAMQHCSAGDVGTAKLAPPPAAHVGRSDAAHRVLSRNGLLSAGFDMNHLTANSILVEQGQRVRLDFVNKTTMWHPMHLHGHTYQLGTNGPRKDTTIVLPKKAVSVYFDADNPGQWMLHCHNAYHGEAGMMALVAYQA